MKLSAIVLALSVLIIFNSCHRYYTSSSFTEKTANHKTIAILPPQMMLSGKQPKELTKEDIQKLEEKESRLFQESLYNNILRRANTNKKTMYVAVQEPNTTLALLEKHNISMRDSWAKEDKELANRLGVDAVVRTTIQKERYLSNLASFGIDMGTRILNTASNNSILTSSLDKTNDIKATCSIVSNGETLWNDSYKREADWNSPANEVIERITGKFAKHFPYKRKASPLFYAN